MMSASCGFRSGVPCKAALVAVAVVLWLLAAATAVGAPAWWTGGSGTGALPPQHSAGQPHSSMSATIPAGDCWRRPAQLVEEAFAADIKTVEVNGTATILNGNVAAARDEAMEDAKEKAVEQVGGVELDSRGYVVMELLAMSDVVTRTRGVVTETPLVICEHADAQGMYHVRCRVKVSSSRFYQELETLSRSHRVLVLDDGASGGLADILKEEMKKIGFQNIVLSGPASQPPGLVRQALDGDVHAARALAGRAQAEVVVLGGIDSGDAESWPGQSLWVADATGRVVAVRAGNGTELHRASLASVKAKGRTKEQALANAAKVVAPRLAKEAARGLSPCSDRSVSISISGLQDYASCDRFKTFLGAMRWVHGVANDGTCGGGGAARFTAQFGRGLEYLASGIDVGGAPSYRVVRADPAADVIEIQATR